MNFSSHFCHSPPHLSFPCMTILAYKTSKNSILITASQHLNGCLSLAFCGDQIKTNRSSLAKWLLLPSYSHNCLQKEYYSLIASKSMFNSTFSSIQLTRILVIFPSHFCKNIPFHCDLLLWVDNKPYMSVYCKPNCVFFGAKRWVC